MDKITIKRKTNKSLLLLLAIFLLFFALRFIDIAVDMNPNSKSIPLFVYLLPFSTLPMSYSGIKHEKLKSLFSFKKLIILYLVIISPLAIAHFFGKSFVLYTYSAFLIVVSLLLLKFYFQKDSDHTVLIGDENITINSFNKSITLDWDNVEDVIYDNVPDRIKVVLIPKDSSKLDEQYSKLSNLLNVSYKRRLLEIPCGNLNIHSKEFYYYIKSAYEAYNEGEG